MQEVKSALKEMQALCKYILHSSTILTNDCDAIFLSGNLTDE